MYIYLIVRSRQCIHLIGRWILVLVVGFCCEKKQKMILVARCSTDSNDIRCGTLNIYMSSYIEIWDILPISRHTHPNRCHYGLFEDVFQSTRISNHD